jgi:hypothetical protein
MKLLNVALARSVWLFNTEDMNPRGMDLVPILAGIQARYKFQRHPTKIEEVYPTDGGIKFGSGSFKSEDCQILVQALTVFNDGLVAETRHSTVVTDAFLVDLLGFITRAYGLAFDPAMVLSKGYFSELMVTTDANLAALTDKFERLANLLSAEEPPRSFKASGIRFGTDPAEGGIPTQFIFERRVGIAYGQKRYFSQAPFSTARHLQILEALEELLD